MRKGPYLLTSKIQKNKIERTVIQTQIKCGKQSKSDKWDTLTGFGVYVCAKVYVYICDT